MAFSISSITGLFRRGKKAQDPFGADDDEDFYDDDVFDDEPESNNVGRKVAIGLSALMGVLLVGFIVTAIFTADETAGPVVSSLPTEIAEVVTEDGQVIPVPSATESDEAAPDTQAAAGGLVALPSLSDETTASPMPSLGGVTSTEIVDDSMVETDRSANRRPWLRTENATGDRLNPDESLPEGTSTPGRATSMQDLLRQSREGTPAPMPTGTETGTAMPTAETAMPSTETAMPSADTAMPSADTAMPATDTAIPTADTAMPTAETVTPAAVPMLPDPGLVPGAPQRFAQSANTDAGPTQVGGAPRLVEPELPPTDSRAVSAAPPRFTTLPKAEQLAQSTTGAARVAIIVEGLGLNKTATEAAIEALPASVTLAFSPYARNLQDWLAKAQEAGHEVLVEVPLESKRFPANDPGPLGLLTSLDQIENVERLSTILEEAQGSAGVLDVTGSRFRESAEHINILLNNLEARGLFYVQGRPGLRLGSNNVASATADIVLDERAFRASIDARLDYIERLAKYQGSSVAVTSAKPVTFERLALWLDQIGERGVSVAPVSEVLIQ